MTRSAASPRVLVISRTFPPVAGVGSLRTAGFSRELCALGWTVTALTVDRRSLSPTLRDDSLEALVPSAVVRLEARDFAAEMGARLRRQIASAKSPAPQPMLRRPKGTAIGRVWRWFTLPDLAFTWTVAAVAAGWRARKSASVVYSCGLPLGSHLAAWILSRAAGRRWVCDFRDPYLWPGVRRFATPLHEACGAWLERLVVQAADSVVVSNEAFLDYFAARYPSMRHKMTSIMNGYDGPAAEPALPGAGPLTLAHAGQFQDDGALQVLIDAMVLARKEGSPVELLMVGAISPAQQAIIRDSDARNSVSLLGRVPHGEVDGLLSRADLLVAESCGPIASLAVRAKVFEYVKSGKPIVAVTDRGSALEGVVSDHRLGYVVEPAGGAALASLLCEMGRRKATGQSLFPAGPPEVESFSRLARAKELDQLLRGAP